MIDMVCYLVSCHGKVQSSLIETAIVRLGGDHNRVPDLARAGVLLRSPSRYFDALVVYLSAQAAELSVEKRPSWLGDVREFATQNCLVGHIILVGDQEALDRTHSELEDLKNVSYITFNPQKLDDVPRGDKFNKIFGEYVDELAKKLGPIQTDLAQRKHEVVEAYKACWDG